MTEPTTERTADPRPPMPRARGRPARLSGERVVAAALQLIDDEGTDALTMRRVGECVGAEAMSLYRHVGSRGELIDAVISHVLEDIELPAPDDPDWETSVRRYARSFREAVLAHPNVFGLLLAAGPAHPAIAREVDAMLGMWRARGLSRPNILRAHATVMAFVFGSVIVATIGPDAPAGGRRGSRAVFEFGLDALISGLRAELGDADG